MACVWTSRRASAADPSFLDLAVAVAAVAVYVVAIVAFVLPKVESITADFVAPAANSISAA